MATLFGQKLTKQEILRRSGSMDLFAGVRQMEYRSGRAGGMGVYEVYNGEMAFTLNIDKCLDMGTLYYRGAPMNFVARCGEMGPLWYGDGENAPRSIVGGMFFTCGFNNVGPLQTLSGGRTLPQHGSLRTSPARLHGATARWEGDDYVITVTGEMREAELFGENLTLRRTFTTRFNEKSFSIRDTFCNEAFREEPMLLLYHCNFGYPFLTEHSRLHLPSLNVQGREPWAQAHLDGWNHMDPPKDNEPEYVYEHRLAANPQGDTLIMVENPDLALGMSIRFNRGVLGNFMQWKSIASGDYVLGLEPTNADPRGRVRAATGENLPKLQPMETVTVELVFTVLDGEDELRACRAEIAALR